MTDADVIALFERSVDDLYRYATRLTGGDRAWAEELVQEVFVQVVRKVRSSPDVDLDEGWLRVACQHRFLDDLKARRRRSRRERRSMHLHERRGPAGQPAFDADYEAFDPTEMLGQLPADQRVVIVLRYVDDQSVPEIAERIGKSVRATESLLARGRVSLRRLMEVEP
jgi:RNA polymerase sigma-70 factor, ECF subfamily